MLRSVSGDLSGMVCMKKWLLMLVVTLFACGAVAAEHNVDPQGDQPGLLQLVSDGIE